MIGNRSKPGGQECPPYRFAAGPWRGQSCLRQKWLTPFAVICCQPALAGVADRGPGKPGFFLPASQHKDQRLPP